MEKKRVFLIVLDSYGIGNAKDAAEFGDEGANTLKSIAQDAAYDTPNLNKLGLGKIDGVDVLPKSEHTLGAYGRLREASKGKDTIIGHWEIAGIISEAPMPTYPNGFPKEIMDEFMKQTGREIICNKPYSGTDVIRDYGDEHVQTGKLIVYTSADSVFQIAAHEDVIPVKELYHYCEIARSLLTGKHSVGRVIARPFIGENGSYQRTTNRHDYALVPRKATMLDKFVDAGYQTYGIGKIYDIFAGKGILHTQKIKSNLDGMEKTIQMLNEDFTGICFVNLVDFDMVYGHRNDIAGYARAATEFDQQLGTFMKGMCDEDILMITADHGCDPGYKGTDHTRECVPFLAYGRSIKDNINLGTRESYADIAATILELFHLENNTDGVSFYKEIKKK